MNFSRYARPYHWLTHHRLWKENARQVAKQLPPSASRLKLLDLGCGPGQTLRDLLELRPDIFPIGLDSAFGMLRLARAEAHCLLADGVKIPLAENSVDAVFAQRLYYFLPADTQTHLLAEAMRVLRPGGRFIMVNPAANRASAKAWQVLKYGFKPALDLFAWHLVAQTIGGFTPESIAERLQSAGYVRILAEPVLDGWGILSRGEKPHAAGASTRDRVKVGASEQTENVILCGEAIHQTPGRYIHLLVQQTPNKPVWALQPEDVIRWEAAAVEGPSVLAFTSLPQAISFMQQAVMTNSLNGINKVVKFNKNTAAAWPFPVLLNPTPEHFQTLLPVVFLPVDRDAAEAPDE